jgi:hypothetical protein
MSYLDNVKFAYFMSHYVRYKQKNSFNTFKAVTVNIPGYADPH